MKTATSTSTAQHGIKPSLTPDPVDSWMSKDTILTSETNRSTAVRMPSSTSPSKTQSPYSTTST